ncbi:MAG: response regulator [Bacteroidales bacterium]|jgi:DNA-binding response OmpR family regulator|nr:response regulator [Bacteroidales bacterium]
MKILVVDDSTVNNILLQEFLENHEFEVHTSLNGKEALELMETLKPDLVLLDIMMPGIDGFAVLNFMNQNSIKIPTIMISAYDGIDKHQLAIKLGAFDYLKKPIDFIVLLNLINKIK